jgi:hypothetical protein
MMRAIGQSKTEDGVERRGTAFKAVGLFYMIVEVVRRHVIALLGKTSGFKKIGASLLWRGTLPLASSMSHGDALL